MVLFKRLFELEIPEINEGIILIYSVAREAGVRTKIAVYSENPNVDPVGACIGQNGSRIHRIIDELNGEKIDLFLMRKMRLSLLRMRLVQLRIYIFL